MKGVHVSGGDEIMAFTLVTLSIAHFFFGFYLFSDQNIRTQNLLISIISGMFLSMSLAGILFKLQYWPGAGILSLFGFMFSTVILMVTIIMMVTGSSAKLKVYYLNMIIRSSILFAISLILLFTPFETLLNMQYWDDPQLARLKAEYYRHPDNKEAKRKH